MNINIALQSQAHTNTKNSTPSNEGSNPSGSDPYNKELTKQRSKNVVKNAFSSGSTYSNALDGERILTQRGRVFEFMADQKFHSLEEISLAVGGSEAAVSARLRDFRKAKYGSYTVIGKRFGDKKSGFWKYQVLPPLSDLSRPSKGSGGFVSTDASLEINGRKRNCASAISSAGLSPARLTNLHDSVVHAEPKVECSAPQRTDGGENPSSCTSLAEINGQFIMVL